MNRNQILIEADELLTKINQPNLRIYDAKILFYMGMDPEEIAKMPTAYEQYLAEHIPGAAFFDHQKFSDNESPYEYMLAADNVLEDQIGRIGISKDTEIILYATDIIATATRAWWLLYYAGLDNMRVLNGGLAAWKAAGGAVEQGEQNYEPVHFEADFNANVWASREEVQAAITMDHVNIENSLPQDWHDQEHIPGSTCLPLTELSYDNEWDAFVAEEKIAARLNNADQHERIITYCGGGIAATMNAVAYLMVGHDNVAVYDGSLYEWKGEGLPVARKE